MRFKIIIALLLFSTAIKAQTVNITPAHLKAAEDMLKSSGADTLFKTNISTLVDQASSKLPDDKKPVFIDVMNKFMNKYISWDILKDQLASLYAQEFTEKELKDLTAFYNTPLGRKLNSKQAILFQKSALLGQQAVQSHQAELQAMLQAAFKE
ncbi:DUF2059 domain-containing protein [Mucilaginibacter segetis]|uniref:DUF2059 domain-containing protein n=1 Tax=Mucilaginibacter segetis TaxID=2793071 RepID=A0A934UNJ7_9SPHI|nr:DUF2059 domain-containing protein [Mucilaginibacter segetis]MBK0380155.1 DUF2059 domain-containing protein [Mucilaginibacter segetis]